MLYKFLIIALIFLINLHSSVASIKVLNSSKKPLCNKEIPENMLKDLKRIEIEVKNNRKWFTHNLRIVKYSAIGGDTIISPKFKKKFKSKVNIIFNKNIECSFSAKIRQHGDFSDHLKLVNGNLFQSVDISLLEGHIDGIINFKLLIPETRKNPNDEIILTELLRGMNYLAPRTNLITVKLNNLMKTMLFQEKEEKEMLEYNLRREGPLLEGDERHVFSKEYKNDYGYIPEQAQLSRQTNPKWALKSDQHENISHEALTRLNHFYLMTKSSEHFNSTFKEHSPNLLNSNLLVNNNPALALKLDIYNAIILSANGDHALAPRNKKFYWDSINNYFEPIYYDGDLNIDGNYSEKWLSKLGFKLQNISNKANFLLAIQEAKKQITEVSDKDFYEKVKLRGVRLSKNQIKEKIDKILKNLDQVKNHVNAKNEINAEKVVKTNDILNNYINYTSKWNFEMNLVFRNNENKKFYKCGNNKENCKEIYFSSKQIRDLLRGRLIINKIPYQYIGEYSNIEDILSTFELTNKNNFTKHKKIKFNDTNFYFDKNISYNYDKEKSIFNIYQNAPEARAYFLGGKIKNLKINFFGNSEDFNDVLKSYPFDQNGLTGCLSFIEVAFDNVSISSINSDCEDSVNLINSKGNINKFYSKNSLKDGLDIDFSKVKIDSVDISLAQNDCVDLSAGNYKLKKLNLNNCGDKGLSVGEKSLLELDLIVVENSTIGIASKDSSITKITDAYLNNQQICLSAYNKKQEFFGGLLEVKNIKCKNFNKKIEQDLNSKIIIQNEL